MSLDIYREFPLRRAREIRLLRFKKSKDSTLQLSLSVVSLDKKPSFTALSYTWGDPQPTHHILCGGVEIPVAKNLHEALVAWRADAGSSYMWIDALCIDQNVGHEKATQVPLMGELYATAKVVRVWLGPETKEAGLAFEHLQRVSAISVTNEVANPVLFQNELLRYQRACFAFYGGTGSTAYSNPIAKCILQTPWFERTWTIQEVVMAKRAILVCGTLKMPWDTFNSALRLLYNHERVGKEAISMNSGVLFGATEPYRKLKTVVLSGSPAKVAANLAKSTVKHGLSRLLGSSAKADARQYQAAHDMGAIIAMSMLPKFETVLAQGRLKKATNPRDKVYGLYGILQSIDGPSLPPVDYSRTVEDVFTAVTRACIQFDGSLSVLRHCSHQPDSPIRLPSWVPNWTETSVSAIPAFQSNATPGSRPVIDFHNDNSITILGQPQTIISKASQRQIGIKLDVDHTTASPSELAAAWLQVFKAPIQASHEWILMARETETYPTGEPSSVALSHVLSFGGHAGSYKLESQLNVLQNSFKHWEGLLYMSALLAGHNAIPNLRQELSVHPDTSRIRREYSINCPGVDTDPFTAAEEVVVTMMLQCCEAKAFHFIVMGAMVGRCFFRTVEGYMGAGPPDTRAEDVVALISGFTQPMVLRPFEGGYRIVGAAYIHGFMRGERWQRDGPEGSRMRIV